MRASNWFHSVGSFKMNGIVPGYFSLLSIIVLSYGVLGGPPMRQMQQIDPSRVVPPMVCGQETLLFYQDCRLCVCPRPNRVAKCYKKACDLRTKDTGQCPPSVLQLQDGKSCIVNHAPGCRVDVDCPDAQLCCFDFCGGSKCVNPFPLDALTGQPHKGRGYM